MSQPKRKRGVQLNFRVSEEELAAIESKMEQLGIFNREAYLRKMALDGVRRPAGPAGTERAALVCCAGTAATSTSWCAGSTLPGGFTRRTWRILSRDRANFGRPLARY